MDGCTFDSHEIERESSMQGSRLCLLGLAQVEPPIVHFKAQNIPILRANSELITFSSSDKRLVPSRIEIGPAEGLRSEHSSVEAAIHASEASQERLDLEMVKMNCDDLHDRRSRDDGITGDKNGSTYYTRVPNAAGNSERPGTIIMLVQNKHRITL